MYIPHFPLSAWLCRSLSLAAIGLLVACSASKHERKVLPVEEMANVLYDYQLASSLAQEEEQQAPTADGMYAPPTDSSIAASRRNYMKYREAVFEKYQITETDYKHSLAFYLRNPEEMKKLNRQLDRRIAQANQSNADTNRSMGGAADSLLLWQKNCVLIDAATANRFVAETKTVGKRLRNDALILSFDAQWLYGGGSKQAQAFLTAQYDNDSLATTYYSVYYFQSHHEVRLPIAKRNLKKVTVQFITSNTWENYSQVVNFTNLRLQRVKDANPQGTAS